ncbi:MAG: cell division protein FtsZ [Prevotellaceae bacterium]|jgi:cell division protein FtsZ|nr:cell division protein FtsZ [Prevotellaceae bacterium]
MEEMNEYIPVDWDTNKGSIIKVIGVGGGGNNAVNHMANMGIKDVDFVLCNTDAQALRQSPIANRIHLGATLTKGRGAGCDPERGKQAAEESMQAIQEMLESNTEMVFITAGMGGGTGTGAAPVIARTAKEMGILTVGIVTFPFRDEGLAFTRRAIEGVKEMRKYVDSLLLINNDKLYEIYGMLGVREAFKKADDILAIAAKGIAEIITNPGYINVDFEDVKKVMKDSGVALMGTGSASGENRALQAVENALNSPLLNNNSISGARNILVNITSGEEKEITMMELGSIMEHIQHEAGSIENMKRGVVYDASLGDSISVTIVATGFRVADIPELGILDMNEVAANPSPPLKGEVEFVSLNDSPTEIKQSQNQQSELTFEISNIKTEDTVQKMETPIIETPSKPSDYKIKTVQRGLTGMKKEDINFMESVPAYKRKNITIDADTVHSSEEGISENILEEEDGKHQIKKDNAFLNPGVD